ncbi:SusC/RagA family TonB-linked outer membrane protein [Zobellia alginiliquefaciens]|uniref:SusC/RagA family TonB-linked outer membrane protein n=1 Tax=Zobellia alginiliquefaciens TaxID=3032586 RepID=UPI0023E3612B|nr:SusC/RagA family TonB-linked outer membrane protein [Zobellia alginiliquefaciens]
MKNLLKLERRPKTYLKNLKMKLSLLFLLVFFTLQASDSLAQRTKITLNLQDVPLLQLIDEIESQSEFRFIYRVKNVNLGRNVSINVNGKPISEVLKFVFNNTNTSYTIVEKDKQIHLTARKIGDKTQSSSGTSSVQYEVRGLVLDEAENPLPGASIVEKGTTNGTTTDFDGNFIIQVANTNATLEVSYLGYKTQEVVLVNSSDIRVSLKPNAGELDEVVVTALGMKRDKKALGYSVGETDTERLNLVPQENALGGLSGKVSGLDVRRSGNDVFAETYVTIRGKTSLTGNDQPLVVIDGAPVGDASVMGDISSMDIETISVLKGASAAALYGSRAGNGVILITTKSGEGKKGIGVSLNSTMTLSSPYKYIDLQNRFTNGQKGQFNEATWQHWYGAEEGTAAVQYNSNGEAVPLQFYDNSLQDYFQTGLTTINDATISGSYDKGNFRLGISHLKGEGITPEAELQRIGMNLGTTYKVTDNFNVSVNINLSNSYSDNYPSNLIGGNDEYFDVYNIAPHININDLKGDLWVENNVQQRNVTEGYNNPWWFSSERQNRFDKIRGFGNIKLDWQITPEFSAMGRASYSSVNNKEEILRPWSYQGFGDTQPFGSYYISTGLTREANFEALFSYTKQLGDFHLSTSVGGNILKSKGESLDAGGDNLVLPGLFTLSNVARAGLLYASSVSEKAIYSAYGLLSLSYKDIAFLDVTARNDWSSTLPKENRSYFYPSVSGSFLVSEALDMPSWVTLVKLRSGWAEVGKDTSPYAIHPILSQGYWGDDYTYSLPSSMPNTNLKPEIATSYEFGTDLKFFEGRLGFDGTYYKNQNKNQILNVDATPLSGYTSTTINAGNVENYGVELGMQIVPIRTKDVEWNMDFNFTTQKSKLVELVDGIDRISFGGGTDMGSFTRVGGEIGDLYSPYIQKVEDGPYAGWNLLDANGRWVVDRTKENQIKVGNFNNDFTLGMTTSFKYKNFTVSASFDWRQGGEFFSESMKRMARSGKIEDWQNGVSSSTFSGILDANSFGGDRDALAEEIKNNPVYRDNDVWVGGRTQELGGFDYNGNYNGAFFPGVIDNGDGTYTENFGAEGTQMFDAYRVVESSGSFWRTGYAFMYDASFVKLRDITFTYDFPKKVAQMISANNVSLSLYSKNIMLWTAAGIGIDPELAYDGGDQGHEKWNLAPWTAPIGFKLNVGF